MELFNLGKVATGTAGCVGKERMLPLHNVGIFYRLSHTLSLPCMTTLKYGACWGIFITCCDKRLMWCRQLRAGNLLRLIFRIHGHFAKMCHGPEIYCSHPLHICDPPDWFSAQGRMITGPILFSAIP